MYISKKVITTILVLALSIAGVGVVQAKGGSGDQSKPSKTTVTNMGGRFFAYADGDYLAKPNAKKVIIVVDVKDASVLEADLTIRASCADGSGSSSSESADKDDLSVDGKKKAKLTLKLTPDPDGCEISWRVGVEDEQSFSEDGGDSRVIVSKMVVKVSAK
ncbi:MAG: hypothetical protein V3V01_04670 [Acidimicrobiales bacterium]